ncbi:hypothetical protein LXA43DRAFT_1091464 [Ganoderma leucocontextum]|nr:hypothetical protein LXA43DRAFT_1091464 [Ganoderma leucocontextum]
MTSFLSRCAIYAPNLVELELSGSEELFAAHPALMRAVGTMACLRKLRLWNAGPQAFGMLRQSHFRLRHAEICGLHEQPPQPSVKDNPIFALYHSRDTLRVLTLENVPFDSDHHMPCYKNVDELTLSSSLVPPVHRLAQNFPNLRVLTVRTYPGYYYLNPAEREEQLQASILRQEQRGTFRALDSYSGSILSLYVFGLTCRIPYVSLRDDEDELCWDASMLQAAEDFVQLCAGADFRGGVRTLSMTFDVWWARDLDLACVVECIYSAVRSSSPRAVELIFDWRGFWEDCNEDVDPDFPPPAETFLRSVDLDVVADELLETTERLETAVVRLRILGRPEVTTQRGPDIDYDDDD